MLKRHYMHAVGVMLMLTATSTFCASTQQSEKASECCSVVDQALEDASRIVKDMSRADVEKWFKQDGGIFSRNETVYVYKLCPTVKIKVTFSLDPSYNGFAEGSPHDLVRSVSKPYLEYPFKD